MKYEVMTVNQSGETAVIEVEASGMEWEKDLIAFMNGDVFVYGFNVNFVIGVRQIKEKT